MRKVIIRNSGWTIWTIPENVMRLVYETLDSRDESEINIHVEDGNFEALRAIFTDGWRLIPTANGSILVDRVPLTTMIRPAPQPPTQPIVPVGVAVDAPQEDAEERDDDDDEQDEEYSVRPPSASEIFLPGLAIGDVLSMERLNFSLAGKLGIVSGANRIETMRVRIQELEQSLLNAYRELDAMTRSVNENESIKHVVDQIGRLLSGRPANKIEGVVVSQNYIIITTTSIIAEGLENKRHNIGRIEIYVPLQALFKPSNQQVNNWQIRIRNKDSQLYIGRIKDAQAPHADCHGRMCLGNAAPMILEAYARGDVISLVDTMIRYLERPNLNDVLGVKVQYWPEVTT